MSPGVPCASVAFVFAVLGMVGCTSTASTNPPWSHATLAHPTPIAAAGVSDGKALYFVTGGTQVTRGVSGIHRLDPATGQVTVVYQDGQRIPEDALAVDDDAVYWVDGPDVLRTTKDGLNTSVLAQAPRGITEIAVDEARVCWLSWTQHAPMPLLCVPKSGGTPYSLGTARWGPNGLNQTTTDFYWAEYDGVYSVPKSGGPVTRVYANTSGWPNIGLGLDANAVYTIQMVGGSDSSLLRVPLQGGPPTVLATVQAADAGPILVDATHVYVSETGFYLDSPVTWTKVPIAGGPAVILDSGPNYGFLNGPYDLGGEVAFTDRTGVWTLPK